MNSSLQRSASRRQKRVLLAMGWYDHRLHRGIAKYAVERGWHLCLDTTKEKVIPWGWEGDGILAWLGVGDDIATFVQQARKPTVDFSFRRPHLPFPRVLVDHRAVAELAADHFCSRGLVNFIVCSDADNWAFEENGCAFVKAMAHVGHTCKWLRWHKSPGFTRGQSQWRVKRQWLASELKHAPKPLAVYATTDELAVEVLEACESAKLEVPEQVSIIGVNNSLLAVNSMRIPISSIDTNLEMVGYRGAALLNDIMEGKPAPSEPIRVPPEVLVARKSSDLIAINHAGVAKSLRLLSDHGSVPIGVDDLVRVSGMSRRALHQAFVEHLGRTPGAELHRVHINLAKKLLADASQRLADIAKHCGYQSMNGFGFAFKKSTGLTPLQYRDQLSHRSRSERQCHPAPFGNRTNFSSVCRTSGYFDSKRTTSVSV